MNESRTESALWCVCTQLKFMHKAANTSATEGSTHSCNLFRNPKFYRSRHGITRYHREPSLVSEFVEVVVMLRCLFFAAALVCAAAPADYFQAIRAGDAARLKACITAGGVNEPDSRQTTPLHYAAAIGNVESVRLLLSAGAKANVVDNAGGTPLLLAATSAEKIGLLLKADADPNLATKNGRTPLHIAASLPDGLPAVRALLDAGAKLDTADMFGRTPFLEAAGKASLETLRLLIAKGADAKAVDKASAGAMMDAIDVNDVDRVALLLKAGADPNSSNTFAGKVRHGDIALTKLTPLTLAATHGSPAIVKALLAAGAKVETKDGRGMTPLMAAVATDRSDPEVVRMLLAAGANPKADDGHGETVADWARKMNRPAVMKAVLAAGATAKPVVDPPQRKSAPLPVTDATNLALTLLGKSSTEFFNQSGCVGCHHQPVIAMAYRKAATTGLKVEPVGIHEMRRSLTATRPLEPLWTQFFDTGGASDTVSSVLIGAAAAGVEASSLTDAGTRYVAARQRADGSWSSFGISRAPFEESNIGRTGNAIRALKAYAWPAIQPEIDARVQRARTWLMKVAPQNSYERAELLLSLHVAGAPAASLKKAAGALLKDQRDDGGWSQTPDLRSDAYATGLALHALHETGMMAATDAVYNRGVAYLLRTQLDDGSWYVRSRSPKFQPYFQSGFPHEHDQWISAPATAWAAMALAPAARQ
jgi:ankyrin repeat protein